MRRAAAFIAVVVVAACGGDGDGDTAADDPLAIAGRAGLESVCEAAGLATRDRATAERTFAASHDELHQIGDALAEVDRAATAEFLRAKSAVEADLSGDIEGGKLSADFDTLVTELSEALTTLDVDAPDC